MVDLMSLSVTDITGFTPPSDFVIGLTFKEGCSATYNGEIYFFGGDGPRHPNGETLSVSNFFI